MILKGYGEEIDSIFQLMGKHENDMTKSIAFVLSKCDSFTYNLLQKMRIDKNNIDLELLSITYQQAQEDGISDIEIIQPGIFHIIIEAKRGFNLPTHTQLKKYANDLNNSIENEKYIWTLSDNLIIDAKTKLDNKIENIQINHITYENILEIIEHSLFTSNNIQKKLLCELSKYLKGVINMQNLNSNVVYVVPISGDSIKEHDIQRTYHCPIGHGFLKSPENYLGFRYGGKLQYINHVDSVETYLGDKSKPKFLFHLGPDIVPNKTIKTGGKYQGTKWYCDIDLLLTCDTIVEAGRKTKERHK